MTNDLQFWCNFEELKYININTHDYQKISNDDDLVKSMEFSLFEASFFHIQIIFWTKCSYTKCIFLKHIQLKQNNTNINITKQERKTIIKNKLKKRIN